MEVVILWYFKAILSSHLQGVVDRAAMVQWIVVNGVKAVGIVKCHKKKKNPVLN